MEWLSNVISVAQSVEDPHTWNKFGETLNTPHEKPTEIKHISKDPIKKRVFGVSAAFWISVILVGGLYTLIEGVNYENIINFILSTINEELRIGQ